MNKRLILWSLAMFALGVALNPLASLLAPARDNLMLVFDRVEKQSLQPGDLGYIATNLKDTWGGFSDPPYSPSDAYLPEESEPAETTRLTYILSSATFLCQRSLLVAEPAGLPASAMEMVNEVGIDGFDCQARLADAGSPLQIGILR